MKKLFLGIVLCGIAAGSLFASLKTLVTMSKAVTTAGTPVRFSATNDYFSQVYILNRATNAGTLYIHTHSAAGEPRIALAPGAGFSITMEFPGDFIDLFGLYIDSTVSGETSDIYGTRR